MGPSVQILLPYSPSDDDVAALDEFARLLGESNKSAADFQVQTTVPLGGATQAGEGGRPFVAGFEDPLLEEGCAEALDEAFGFVPISVIGVGAMCNDQLDHRILGELSIYLARHFGGLVDFTGLLPVTEPQTGKLVRIPYAVDGRQLFYHVGDVTFMSEWLRHPAFHMVK